MSFINCLYLIFVYRPIKAVINRGQSHFDLPGGNCKSNENLWTQGLETSVCTIFRMAESCLAEDVVRKSPRTLTPLGSFLRKYKQPCASPAKIRQIKTLSCSVENLCLSFLRKQESIIYICLWIPAFAGMTDKFASFQQSNTLS
jgi:hypothetical protein